MKCKPWIGSLRPSRLQCPDSQCAVDNLCPWTQSRDFLGNPFMCLLFPMNIRDGPTTTTKTMTLTKTFTFDSTSNCHVLAYKMTNLCILSVFHCVEWAWHAPRTLLQKCSYLVGFSLPAVYQASRAEHIALSLNEPSIALAEVDKARWPHACWSLFRWCVKREAVVPATLPTAPPFMVEFSSWSALPAHAEWGT